MGTAIKGELLYMYIPTPKASTASSRDVKLTTEMPGRPEADWGALYCFTVRMRTGRGGRELDFPFLYRITRTSFLNLKKRELFFKRVIRSR